MSERFRTFYMNYGIVLIFKIDTFSTIRVLPSHLTTSRISNGNGNCTRVIASAQQTLTQTVF